MSSDQPNQQIPIVNGEPAQLSCDDVAPESFTDPHLTEEYGAAAILIITVLPSTLDMSLIAPSSPSSLSSAASSLPTTFLTPLSPSPNSSHVPLTPPPTPPPQVDSASTYFTTNKKRKYSNEENTSPAFLKRIFKHQVNLEDVRNQNLSEEQLKSIKKSKSCKEQRDRKAARVALIESENERLRQENCVIPELFAEISRLKVMCSTLNEKDRVISKLEAKIALLENQIAWQTDPISTESDIPWIDLPLENT